MQIAFATWSIVGKVTLAIVPPLALVTLRLSGAAMIFAVMALVAGREVLPPRAAIGRIVGLALAGMVLNQLLFTFGLHHTTAINSSILGATIPVLTIVYAVASRRERGRIALWAGLVIALLGTFLVARPERVSLSDEHLFGNALIIVNCMAYSVYLVRGREVMAEYGAERVIAWCFLAAALMVAPFGIGTLVAHGGEWSARTWLACLYVVLFPTAFAYAANGWAMARAPSSIVAVFIYLQPMLAIAMAVTLGDPLARWLGVPEPHETLTVRATTGMGAIMLGVWVTTQWKVRRLDGDGANK